MRHYTSLLYGLKLMNSLTKLFHQITSALPWCPIERYAPILFDQDARTGTLIFWKLLS